ncbi:OsmC family peroxiredoxin [Motiliproteus coralliicola]|uniref:OsmC family peroxiredoxin n=1 Tax=Motiliproteus coralliicola TaxID=2283196 RepID=A0A369WLY9_9GAMM|nr:OsmC family protein [Motiliproteus coralliicola]RDE22732.1 OsmC family peroxiredoxin [Motiliproteus coralliicola]
MPNKVVSVSATMGNSYTITADVRGHHLTIDQPQNARGNNEGPTPLELFLFSMSGCVATIARTVAMQERLELRGMEVIAEGELNPAGLLGKPTEDRTGFQQIRISATIDADMTDAEKAEFLDRVCDRCPVHDNVKLSSEVVHQLG